jgi:chaperonin cofactor prefoldin
MSSDDKRMDIGMSTKLKVIGAAIATLVMSGCASMSSDECMMADWNAVGYEDGVRGYTTERFSNHRKACAKHGVTPSFADYKAGREKGLEEYCQPGRGFDVGVSAGRYYGVCSVNLEPDFLDAYNVGRRLYTLRANVDRASSQINSKERELEDVAEEIREQEAALIAGETTTEERILILADLKDLSERTGTLETEIEHLYDERARYRVELENYQASIVDYGY